MQQQNESPAVVSMNTSKRSGHEIVASLVSLQKALYLALQCQYSFTDHEFLTDAPRFGNVTTSDIFWEFTRHGRGFRFEAVPSGEVVDILIYKPKDPEFFDALRLSEYAESIGIDELSFLGDVVDACSEKAIERQLCLMVTSGTLCRHAIDKHLFRLS